MMADCMKNVRENLMRIKWSHNWSNLELSIQCDTPPSTIDTILYGTRKDPRISTIARIAESLEVPISALLEKGGEE